MDPQLPGVRVRCCHSLTVLPPPGGGGSDAARGCIANESQMPCIDPFDAGNGDSTLSSTEADAICKAKCPPLPGDYPFQGPVFEAEEGGGGLGISPPFIGCNGSTGTVLTNAIS